MTSNQQDTNPRAARMRHALWGCFIGDALAMPAHWFYQPQHMTQAFQGEITGYVAPPHPHPDSFMVGMQYRPDVERAKQANRPYDILHEHARFYRTSYTPPSFELQAPEGEHGNSVPQLTDRYHYHHGLAAGENTLGAQLVRLLMRSVVRHGRYEPSKFLKDFVDELTTPGKVRDPYREVYLRCWFENYALGLPEGRCAAMQREVWSIGSLGGMIRPLVVSLLASSAYQGLGLAIEHQNLTHRSENVAAALMILIPLLHGLLRGHDPGPLVETHARHVRLPRVTGKQLSETYRKHQGPANIPSETMWSLHTDLRDQSMDLEQLANRHHESEVIGPLLSIACYPEHGLPLMLYLLHHHAFRFKNTIFANTNAGGDNVHRGMILGMLLGAANNSVPEDLKAGLTAARELEDEIDQFVSLALS